jgi:hypothetical protein
MLATLPTTGTNAPQMFSTIAAILKSSSTTNVDPVTGNLIPQSTLSVETTTALAKIVSQISTNLNNPTFTATLTPTDGNALAAQLLEVSVGVRSHTCA